MSQHESTERVFDLNGRTIAALEWGEPGGQPLLALHGWLDNAASFELLAPHLKGFHIVALDLAGHGRSDHLSPDSWYSLWGHLADVSEVVRQLGWKRFALLGHSMGAGIACWYAGTFPKQINRLGLLDGFGAAFSVEAPVLPRHFKRAIRAHHMAASVPINRFSKGEQVQFQSREAAVRERMNGKFGRLTEHAAQTLLARGLAEVDGGFRWRNDPRIALPALMEPNEATICAFLERIEAPACLILGDQGLFAQGEKGHRLAHFQNLSTHTLKGGHHLHLEAAATEIAGLLNLFFVSSLEPTPHFP